MPGRYRCQLDGRGLGECITDRFRSFILPTRRRTSVGKRTGWLVTIKGGKEARSADCFPSQPSGGLAAVALLFRPAISCAARGCAVNPPAGLSLRPDTRWAGPRGSGNRSKITGWGREKVVGVAHGPRLVRSSYVDKRNTSRTIPPPSPSGPTRCLCGLATESHRAPNGHCGHRAAAENSVIERLPCRRHSGPPVSVSGEGDV